jgi:hypothetical protein
MIAGGLIATDDAGYRSTLAEQDSLHAVRPAPVIVFWVTSYLRYLKHLTLIQSGSLHAVRPARHLSHSPLPAPPKPPGTAAHSHSCRAPVPAARVVPVARCCTRVVPVARCRTRDVPVARCRTRDVQAVPHRARRCA